MSRRATDPWKRLPWLLLAAAVVLSVVPGEAKETSPAPHITLRTLDDQIVSLADLYHRGPVLIDFWATWCKPCVQSLPEMKHLHEQYAPRGLTVIGISIDGPRNFARVRPFVTRLELDYPIVLDEDGSLQRRFKVTAIPTAVLIDTTGMIILVRSGYRPGEGDELADAIEALLPSPADTTQ